MSKRIILSFLAALLLVIGPVSALGEEELVAKVNGTGIGKAEFERNWPRYLQQRGLPGSHADKSGKVDELKMELLNLLIDQELLYQAAVKGGFEVPEEQLKAEIDKSKKPFPTPEAYEEALAQNNLTSESFSKFVQRRMLVQKMVEKKFEESAVASKEEIAEYYNGNQARFKQPESVRARHILIKVAADADDATKEAARKKVEDIVAKLNDGEDFSQLAKENSEGPSAPKGGDLGFFGRGQMVPPFEEAVFALKPGEIAGPVETKFGYHAIKLEEKKEARTVPLEEVSESIQGFLKDQKMREAVVGHLKTLKEEAKIETFLE